MVYVVFLTYNIYFYIIFLGVLTNSSFMPQHHKCNNGNDAQSNPAIQKRIMATSSTSNFTNAGKAASNLTRALQNVI